jgi:predicted nucleic acid-binding protein
LTPYIIDASVIVKWFIPEHHSELALRLRNSSYQLHAPAFIALEVGNVLCKKRRRGEIGEVVADDIWDAFRQAPLRRHTDEPLVPVAFDLAVQTKQSLYDCLYLALSIKLKEKALTADRKFFQALQHSAYSRHVCWLEDLP